jgi:uncharacterized membrane protein
MNDIAMLQQISFFSQMDEQEIAGILKLMQPLQFAAGDIIIEEGDVGDLFYVLTEGHVKIVVLDDDGDEVVVEEIYPGGLFGELSMITGEPRSARAQAVEDSVALTLGREDFFNFLLKYPHASIDILSVLGKRLYTTTSLLRHRASRNVNQILDEQLTLGQRIADGVASTMGSWRFIIIQSTVLFIWIILNIAAWVNHWDPYPFILLNLTLSFQAAYAAPIIMMSQNRQAHKDRLAAEIDHQVNEKAELEIGMVLRRLDDLERKLSK